MKRPLAAFLACTIMAGMLWTGLRRPDRSTREPSATPPQADPVVGQGDPNLRGVSDRIETLLEASRKGDLASYLDSFGGAVRARLEHQAEERGRAAFVEDLLQAARARRSHAVFAPEPDGAESGSARIVVESTYLDRIDRQTFRLIQGGTDWRIVEMDIARERLPERPLGSLATFQEPEGVPVELAPDPGSPSVDTGPESN